ncbi:MAG: 4Fe-4S dicluster domain-containing protein [Polyangiales bacterium]
MSTLDEAQVAEMAEGVQRAQVTRRNFLMTVTAAVAGTAACGGNAWEGYFQQHYKRLTDEEKRALIARLEAEALARHGVRVHVSDPAPLQGVEFGYALNLSACIGCRRCEYACAQENNTSRAPELHYIRVLEIPIGTLDVIRADTTYEGQVPHEGKFYMPVQCHQCRNAPCVRACPVKATWQEPDGVIVVDYDWCIGCRYCEVACPYYARRFNMADPAMRPSEVNPDQGLLSNRAREKGVMEKCHFCLHRTRRGEYPACLEACPTGARKFGNLLDPNSEVRQVLATKRVYVFREDAGTLPRFYYYFD